MWIPDVKDWKPKTFFWLNENQKLKLKNQKKTNINEDKEVNYDKFNI